MELTTAFVVGEKSNTSILIDILPAVEERGFLTLGVESR
jgi:hypothetical protein